MKGIKPRLRRTIEVLTTVRGALTVFTAINAGILAGQVWVKNIVTRDNVRVVVEEAVSAAMVDARARIINLEDKTSDLSSWKISTRLNLEALEKRDNLLELKLVALPLLIIESNKRTK